MKSNYGLIGKKLGHSFSKSYFTNKFKKENLSNCIYDNYEIEKTELLGTFLSKTKAKGLNVTIPYKEQIIPFLDDLDPHAQAIGAVNTIKTFPDGRKKGFNTDYIGFQRSLDQWDLKLVKRALVLGSGGASKAIEYGLKMSNILPTIVSRRSNARSLSYSDLNEKVLKDHQLIINCTPLGMFPEIYDSPPIPFHFLNDQHFVYDLIYNPESTLLMQNAQKQGAKVMNGLQMLIYQAEEAWKIWNDPTIL